MKKECYQKAYNLDAWRSIHITQLAYIRNLILVLSIGALGYVINQYGNNTGQTGIKFLLLLISELVLLISIAIGLFIAMAEAENYRLYRTISRIIEQSDIKSDQSFDDSVFKNERKQCDRIEANNKVRARWQVWLFFLGIVFISFLHLLK